MKRQSIIALALLTLLMASVGSVLAFGIRQETIINNFTEDFSASMPSVSNQTISGADDSAIWAMGYYYKGYQETVESGSTVTLSPYFMYDLGGRGSAYFASELLTGHGISTLETYPSVGMTMNSTILTEAATHKSLGAAPFWINTVKTKNGFFSAKYKNKIELLTNYMATKNDCVVIGVPQFATLVDYTSGLYAISDATAEVYQNKILYLCVVGYGPDVFTNTNAFKVVGSFGTPWGYDGYAYLSGDFVKTFAVEAWYMTDQTTFTATDFASKATYQYTGSGSVSVTDAGIAITGGAATDMLNIRRNKGVAFANPIPLVQTNGGFKKFYSDVNVTRLVASSAVGAVSTKSASIGEISAPSVTSINMADSPDSTWYTLSGYLGYHGDSFDLFAETVVEPTPSPAPYSERESLGLNNSRGTTIYIGSETTSDTIAGSRAASVSSTRITLTGVMLQSFNAPSSALTIAMSSKAVARKGLPKFASQSGVAYDETNPATIDGLSIPSITAKGCSLYPGSIDSSGTIGKISVASGLFSTVYPPTKAKYVFPIKGDLWLSDGIAANGSIGSIAVVGGYLFADEIVAGTSIGTLSVKSKIIRNNAGIYEALGGFLGKPGSPEDLAVATGTNMTGSDSVRAATPTSNIRSVFGDFGVSGYFYAGASSSPSGFTPLSTGTIGSIGAIARVNPNVSSPIATTAIIEGQAWVRENTIKINGGSGDTYFTVTAP
jgi:hypothetical protein